ncbi:hypothetical protein VNO77_08753 [Canavalia gladiata]|uniref:Uncharacterized protein n=1 Tax=Canavalia gladiata TaxID=3824 RepID=A0AAN9MFC6_CANGL
MKFWQGLARYDQREPITLHVATERNYMQECGDLMIRFAISRDIRLHAMICNNSGVLNGDMSRQASLYKIKTEQNNCILELLLWLHFLAIKGNAGSNAGRVKSTSNPIASTMH